MSQFLIQRVLAEFKGAVKPGVNQIAKDLRNAASAAKRQIEAANQFWIEIENWVLKVLK